MKGKELEMIRSGICAGSPKEKREFLNCIEPVVRKFTNNLGKGTPISRRRQRIMKSMAFEMLYNGCYPYGETAESFLVKFFSELYSVH